MMTAALVKANIETLSDTDGRPLLAHTEGEAVPLFKCAPDPVQVRHSEDKCCNQLPVWAGENFMTPAYDQPTNKKITSVCTQRICNMFENPMFNIGTKDEPGWIQVNGGNVHLVKTPKDFIPLSTNKGQQIVVRQSGVYSDKQKR